MLELQNVLTKLVNMDFKTWFCPFLYLWDHGFIEGDLQEIASTRVHILDILIWYSMKGYSVYLHKSFFVTKLKVHSQNILICI